MSQIPGQNKIAEAVVEITADTKPLEQGIDKANAEIGKLGTTGAATGLDIASNMLPAAAAIAAVGAAALEAGKQIGEGLEKRLNNGTGDDFLFTQEDKLRDLRKKAEEYRKEATKTSVTGTLDDLLSNGTADGILASDRAKAVKNYNDTVNQIAEIEAQRGPNSPEALRKKEAKLQKEIDQAELATLDGAERIERRRQQAIERIRKEYGDDNEQARRLKDLINQGADQDIQKWNENQQKKQDKELEDIKERKNAYMDLIYATEAERKKSEDRIAEHAAQAMARALSSIASQYDALTNGNRVAMTLDAINANLKALVNKRQG